MVRKFEILRICTQEQNTIGVLFEVLDRVRRQFVCYTLEDAYQPLKIPGQTRIPAGIYKIDLRTEGGSHERYSTRFDFHKGMLWLREVPNFQYIYIHVGNTAEDTEGCILVGTSANMGETDSMITNSVSAYRRVYPRVADHILRGDIVVIEIVDYEG